MGVNISELLPKQQISFEDLKNKKIAVDSSNMLYQFLASIRQRDGTLLMNSNGQVTSHLVGILSRVTNLMSKDIKLAFVFDGKPPALKHKEQQDRRERKAEAEKKLESAESEEEMLKYSKQSIYLTKEMCEEAKELLKYLGLPVIQAPSESDAQAAFMCENNDVYAVASSDVDSLLHGCPRLLRNLTLSTKRKAGASYVEISPELISLQDSLKHLDITQDQLIALAILVGTDYNRGGIKGIGPKKAINLVRETHDFDELFKRVNADFNWKKIYAIFKSMPIMKNYQLNWQEPDEEKIKSMLIDRFEFSEDRINHALEKLQKKPRSQNNLKKWF